MDYKKLFNLFVGNDPQRQLFNQPFQRNGKYAATDGHSLIFISSDGLELNFPVQEGPQIERVIPLEENCNVQISVADVDKQLVPDMVEEEKVEGEEKQCAECEGKGEVEWSYSGKRDYERMQDCPECGGSGTVDTSKRIKTGRKVVADTKAFEMLDMVFTYRELRRLIDAAQLIGAQTITKVFGAKRNGNLFIVGDFKILVMPLVITGYNDSETKRDITDGNDWVTKINLEEKAQV